MLITLKYNSKNWQNNLDLRLKRYEVMMKISLPFKIGVLMTLAIALLIISGYFVYTSLSSIVASIEVKSKPDMRLLAIRELAGDLDKADNSVRIYTLTRKQKDIRPYYQVLDGIDDKLNALRDYSSLDTILLAQVDTISSLIEDKMVIWNKMLYLHHSDSLDVYIRKLSAKVAVSTLNTKAPEKKILKRLFGSRKAEKAEEEKLAEEAAAARQSIINDINRIEQVDSLKQTKLVVTEARLANTSDEIRERLYTLISRMENEVYQRIHNNAIAAGELAEKTYRRLAIFAMLGTLLAILVLVVVVRYVQKTREVQRALERSKNEAEQLALTKEMFMANMSHEIRTPVNAIYGFAEQLLHEPLDEKSRNMIGIVKSSADHLSQVVNDILDFSKLQHASIELEKANFDIRKVCEEIKLLFERKAREKNTRLQCFINPVVPEALLGDAYRLKQIIINLVSNAVKFTTNGDISITVNAATFNGSSFQLLIAVSDTGIGIDKNMQQKVFDDFTQAEAGTSRKYGGTGLGLSIVKKLVELHHGELTLESEINRGTSITCKIPCQAGDPAGIPASTELPAIPGWISQMNFLIVDDEDYNRMLFKTILTRWKATYDEAADGHQALSLIRENHYHMVFMDARMPVMDGPEATRQIRNELGKSQENLPVICISATHTQDDLKTFREAGMNTFLPKPFTEKLLLDTIVKLADSGLKQQEVSASTAMESPETPGEPAHTVNLDSLYHLAGNDRAFVRQLLLTFIESTESGLQSLHEAIDKSDKPAIRELAHKISSPCKHLGADSLYANFKLMEELAQQNDNLAELTDLAGKSSHIFRDIKSALQEHLTKMEVQ